MSLGELPKYKCHKEVWALKIARIDHYLAGDTVPDRLMLVPEDKHYLPFALTDEFVRRHNPQPGGYYVVYEDGYCSYSPAEVFEAGYTRI